eukprot:200922-Pleurochrysis_carterae.AAC.1
MSCVIEQKTACSGEQHSILRRQPCCPSTSLPLPPLPPSRVNPHLLFNRSTLSSCVRLLRRLKVGDHVVVGTTYGKVRVLQVRGAPFSSLPPSRTPLRPLLLSLCLHRVGYAAADAAPNTRLVTRRPLPTPTPSRTRANALQDESGNKMSEALPSTPVRFSGLKARLHRTNVATCTHAQRNDTYRARALACCPTAACESPCSGWAVLS